MAEADGINIVGHSGMHHVKVADVPAPEILKDISRTEAAVIRDNAGNMANRNAYMTFCSHLDKELISLNEQMPMISKYYLRREANIPEYKEFIYEIKSNR